MQAWAEGAGGSWWQALGRRRRRYRGAAAPPGEAPSAPFTSASISAIFAKVPLMVTTGRGGAGLHTT